jgi:hypothetical protein
MASFLRAMGEIPPRERECRQAPWSLKHIRLKSDEPLGSDASHQ